MLPEPKISYKPFWGICRPLNSWRANSPNPIQIYCAYNKHSLAVYEKFGFQWIDSVQTDIGNGFIMDDYILEYRLNRI